MVVIAWGERGVDTMERQQSKKERDATRVGGKKEGENRIRRIRLDRGACDRQRRWAAGRQGTALDGCKEKRARVKERERKRCKQAEGTPHRTPKR